MEVSTTEKQSMAKLDRNPEETACNRPQPVELQEPQYKEQEHQDQESETNQTQEPKPSNNGARKDQGAGK